MNCNFTPFPVLSTDRLVLRQITLEDDQEIFFQRSDKTMNQYVHNPLAQSIEDARAWITRINTGISNNENIAWAVTLKEDPKVMGGFCIWNLSEEHNRAEIGFSIFPDHQRKGYMHEVLQVGIRYGFDVMHLDIIEAYTHPQNTASIRVLEKNNFRVKDGNLSHDGYIVYELCC